MELAAFVTTSLITNALAVGLYIWLRYEFPASVPDVGTALLRGTAYVAPRLGAFFGFGVLLLFFSSSLAFLAAIVAANPARHSSY